MWGNVLGWKISAAIFVVAMGLALWLRGQMEMTGPTGLSLNEKNLEELSPPVDAEGIVAQDEPGDAGENYEKAAKLYAEDSDACDEYGRKAEGPPPPAMQMVIDAMHFSKMDLFAKNPASIIDYQADHPDLENLSSVGEDMEKAALLLNRAGKQDEARKLLQADYAMGKNLVEERLNYDEFSHGMGRMDGALTALADLEPAGSHKAQELQDQANAMVNFEQQNIRPVYEVLASIDPMKVAANAGDVYRFSILAKERMFRVEAILKVGRYRFNAARPADQLGAPRYLRLLARDPDPVIQAAAQAATGLTLEQYRMIH
jgi:hypothetical protein